ncbi:MAG: CRISPR-associated helicase Cas3' [Syntrophaceae bacterium]|nr:CRISPR-associated helicase Cas3' [Syntrophaceae bacterium]
MTTDVFKKITGHDPYPHQIKTYEALARGESVILCAPTGSGKSEAVFVPFVELRGRTLPNSMIYSLPMRALVNSLEERFKGYGTSLDVKAQHGKRAESVLFDADCIVATLDQVITSYVCAPLSLGVRHGNIPAGAVASSFHVFDEVHTFEPLLGLQSSLILAERMKNMAIPFAIMSATLPAGFISSLSERLGARSIDAEEHTIPARAKRVVTLRENLNEQLSSDRVLNLHNDHNGRTIVVCNTVGRAIDLYLALKDRVTPKPILIHSRYFDDDRAEKEVHIKRLFGRESKEKALLITTQVIEVGMDISCDLLVSELAPVDALIQRAGRCARWGGKGEIIVFGISCHAPYEQALINKTKTVVEKNKDQRLTWDLEKEMVNEVLEETFAEFAKPEAGARAMMYLSKAAFEGKPATAEKAVRDALSVEISIHDNPKLLGNRVLWLPRCKVHPGTLKQFFINGKPKLWRIEQDRNVMDDYHPQVEVILVKYANDIHPNGFYVIHSGYASYHPEEGLVLGKRGAPAEPVEPKDGLKDSYSKEIPHETWKLHALRTVDAFEKYILPGEDFVYSRLASCLPIEKEWLLSLIRLVLLLHDLGKLTEEWQKKIGAEGEFLAHSGNLANIKLPPHATVSAYVLRDYLRKKWDQVIGDAAFFAIAHHHSVRAAKVPRYNLCKRWAEEINSILSERTGIRLEQEEFRKLETQDSPTTLSNHIPAFEKEKTYNLYAILSRALRLSDRRATTQESEIG